MLNVLFQSSLLYSPKIEFFTDSEAMLELESPSKQFKKHAFLKLYLYNTGPPAKGWHYLQKTGPSHIYLSRKYSADLSTGQFYGDIFFSLESSSFSSLCQTDKTPTGTNVKIQQLTHTNTEVLTQLVTNVCYAPSFLGVLLIFFAVT